MGLGNLESVLSKPMCVEHKGGGGEVKAMVMGGWEGLGMDSASVIPLSCGFLHVCSFS